MTYKEAKELIEQKTNEVTEITRTLKPSREVEGFLIAPINIYSDKKMRDHLMNKCIRSGEDNEIILAEYTPHSFMSDQLIPFVIVKMNGNLISFDLNGYLEGAYKAIDSGNAW